jgi:hypothetical protein
MEEVGTLFFLKKMSETYHLSLIYLWYSFVDIISKYRSLQLNGNSSSLMFSFPPNSSAILSRPVKTDNT